MASIYIHIPFCKQACHYCDFHFSTNLRTKSEMLGAIHKELVLQKSYLGAATIDSIYIGGGTPSLLEVEEIAVLLDHIHQLFDCKKIVEITLEANPDDIHLSKLIGLREAGINRLSIGIQSFQDVLLTYLRRAHNAAKALASLEMIVKAGFKNFSIDLIYAIPGQTEAMLKNDLITAIQFQPTHISTYCLTIEPNTTFGRWLEKGKIKAVEEQTAVNHFNLLVDFLIANNYDHYEISNFSLPQYHAYHNTNYWKRGIYLGVGPGAHSYNSVSRQHNITNNQLYIRQIQADTIPSTMEILQPREHINEYIMTSLRTKWGCDLSLLKTNYGYNLQQEHHTYIEKLIDRKLACINQDKLILTTAGKLLADKIATDLFVA